MRIGLTTVTGMVFGAVMFLTGNDVAMAGNMPSWNAPKVPPSATQRQWKPVVKPPQHQASRAPVIGYYDFDGDGSGDPANPARTSRSSTEPTKGPGRIVHNNKDCNDANPLAHDSCPDDDSRKSARYHALFAVADYFGGLDRPLSPVEVRRLDLALKKYIHDVYEYMASYEFSVFMPIAKNETQLRHLRKDFLNGQMKAGYGVEYMVLAMLNRISMGCGADVHARGSKAQFMALLNELNNASVDMEHAGPAPPFGAMPGMPTPGGADRFSHIPGLSSRSYPLIGGALTSLRNSTGSQNGCGTGSNASDTAFVREYNDKMSQYMEGDGQSGSGWDPRSNPYYMAPTRTREDARESAGFYKAMGKIGEWWDNIASPSLMGEPMSKGAVEALKAYGKIGEAMDNYANTLPSTGDVINGYNNAINEARQHENEACSSNSQYKCDLARQDRKKLEAAKYHFCTYHEEDCKKADSEDKSSGNGSASNEQSSSMGCPPGADCGQNRGDPCEFALDQRACKLQVAKEAEAHHGNTPVSMPNPNGSDKNSRMLICVVYPDLCPTPNSKQQHATDPVPDFGGLEGLGAAMCRVVDHDRGYTDPAPFGGGHLGGGIRPGGVAPQTRDSRWIGGRSGSDGHGTPPPRRSSTGAGSSLSTDCGDTCQKRNTGLAILDIAAAFHDLRRNQYMGCSTHRLNPLGQGARLPTSYERTHGIPVRRGIAIPFNKPVKRRRIKR